MNPGTKIAGCDCIGIEIDEEDKHFIYGRSVFLSAGYPAIWVNGKTERLHRLIMRPPPGMGVDHINRNKLDVRRSNLRLCKQSDNCLNVPARKDSKTGIRGVWFDSARGKWAAQISFRKARINLGRFETKEAAVLARKQEEQKLWGEYAPI